MTSYDSNVPHTSLHYTFKKPCFLNFIFNDSNISGSQQDINISRLILQFSKITETKPNFAQFLLCECTTLGKLNCIISLTHNLCFNICNSNYRM